MPRTSVAASNAALFLVVFLSLCLFVCLIFFLIFLFSFFFLLVVLPVVASQGGHDSDATTPRIICFVYFVSLIYVTVIAFAFVSPPSVFVLGLSLVA